MKCAVCGRELVPEASFCPACGEPTGTPPCDEARYEAFFSYRHVERDSAVARRLQRRVEGFRIPRELRKAAGRARLGKCFRDEDELPTSSSLPDMIEDALRHARYLVVICSPEMRESLWVAREVELFASYHGREKILLVLADGEPDTAFPPLLMTRSARDGERIVELPQEPVAADARPGSRKRLSDEALRIVAPIVGCGYDDLKQRERTRRMRRAVAAASGVAAVSLSFGAFALFQQAQIQANYEAALENQSEYLADEARSLLADGNRIQAIQVALRALGADGSGERPYVPSARLALEEACQVYPGTFWRPSYARPAPEGIASEEGVCLSADGSCYAVLDYSGGVSAYRVEDGALLFSLDSPGDDLALAEIAFCGDLLICAQAEDSGTMVRAHNAESGALAWETSLPYRATSLAASEKGACVALTSSTYLLDTSDPITATVLSAADGSALLPDVALVAPGGTQIDHIADKNPLALSGDGATLVQAVGNALLVIDLATGETSALSPDVGSVSSLLVQDGVAYVSTLAIGSREAAAECHLTACDLATSSALWTWSTPATGTLTETFAPVTLEMTKEGQLLVVMGSHVMLFDAASGALDLDLETGGTVSTAHIWDGGGLTYVCDGSICIAASSTTALDSQGVATIGSGFLAPTLYGGGTGETGASGIAFFTGADGEKRCLLADSDRTLVYQLDMEQSLPGREALDAEAAAALDAGSSSNTQSASGAYAFALDQESSLLHVLSCESFELVATIDLSGLVDEAPYASYLSITPSAVHDDVVYACVGQTIYAVEVPTGTVLGRYEDEGASVGRLACRDDEVLLAMQDYEEARLVTLDARTLEEHSAIVLAQDDPNATLSPTVTDLGSLGSLTLAVVDGRMRAYDAQTGEAAATDIEGIAPATVNGPAEAQSHELDTYLAYQNGQLTFNADHTRVLVCEADGTLAQYNEHGEKTWELAANTVLGGAASYLRYLPDGTVFAQNEVTQGRLGQCFLIDGETGAVIASSEAVSTIGAARLSADGSTLYAQSVPYGIRALDTAFVDGIAAINLDPEAFGVQSEMYLAKLVSADGTRALFYDQYQHAYFTLPIYTTDELIAYAQALVPGHELTGSEQRLYHLD